jgi:hypothetical protein
MNLDKKIFFKVLTIVLISVSFFLGYFLRENAVGGGLEFYSMEWPIIQSLKNDFLFTINNYGLMNDYTMPFVHMMNAYLNPFSNDITNFQLSNTIISFLIFLVFAIVLKKIFSHINFVDILLISSVFLILPFFRTSAFWGKQENYGWLFLVISFYFFFEVKKNISKNPNNRDILNVIFFCLTSACALYARQALFFLPISFLLYLFFNKAKKKIIITSFVSFTLFSIPGFLLMWTWGAVFHAVPGMEPWGSFLGGWINHNYILKNLPILLSFFGFYLLPILVIEFLNSDFKYFIRTYYKSFLFALIIFAFLSQINLLNYLGEYTLAGGAVLKLNYLIQKNNFFLLLIFSAIGFSVLMRFIKEDAKNSLIIFFPIIIIYGFPKLLYQEYVEPLILIVFFLHLKTKLHSIYFKNISLSHFVFLSYFAIYLIGSIYFKHFAFSSFEEWKIFLKVQ